MKAFRSIAQRFPLPTWAELIVLFVAMPLVTITPLPSLLKVTIVLAAIVFCFSQMHYQGWLDRQILLTRPSRQHFKPVLWRFALFALLSTLLVAVYLPDELFKVVIYNPLLWFGICWVYVLVSVIPQELIYRVYFLKRFKDKIAHPWAIMFANASLFCLAHIMFGEPWVMVLTFVGGLLFTYTYVKTQCFLLVSLEHTLYGLWLFTLGVGDKLAFPGP